MYKASTAIYRQKWQYSEGNTSKSVKNSKNNQKLRSFTVELDEEMKGINPVTGKSTTLPKINGFALYNMMDLTNTI